MEIELPKVNNTQLDKLKLRKRNQALKNPNCIINKEGFNETKSHPVIVYTCACSGKEILICESCTMECHKGHKVTRERKEEVNFFCGCALSNHKVNKFEESKEEIDKNQKDIEKEEEKIKNSEQVVKVKCSLNKIFKEAFPKFYFEDNKKKNFCYFCIKFCQEKNFEDFKQIPVESYKGTVPKCCCLDKKNHSNFYQNSDCLVTVLTNEEIFSEFVNLQMLFPVLILQKNEKLFQKYIQPIVESHERFNTKIKSGEYTQLQDESLPNKYNSCLNILLAFGKLLKSNYYLIDSVNPLHPTISISYIYTVFNTKEDKNDALVFVKVKLLFLFRKFYILPKINSRLVSFIGWDNNTNPIHRIIFSKPISNFFDTLQISESNFLELLNRVFVSISSYFDLVPEKEYVSLILEYLKIVNILINYRFNDADVLLAILDKVSKIYKLVLSTKFELQKVGKYIENILYNVLLKQNDDIIYFRLIKEKNVDMFFSFETSSLSVFIAKMIFSQDLKVSSKSVNMNKNEVFDIYINKNDLYAQSMNNILKSQFKNFDENLNIFTEAPSSTRLFEYLTPYMQKKIKKNIQKFEELHRAYFDRDFESNESFYTNAVEVFEKSYIRLKDKIIKLNRDKTVLFYQQTYIFSQGYVEALFKAWSIFTNVRNIEKNFSLNQLEAIANIVIDILILITHDNPFLISVFFNEKLISKFFHKEENKPRKIIFLKYYEFYFKIAKTIKKYKYSLNYSLFVDRVLKVESFDNWDEKVKASNLLLKTFSVALQTSLQKLQTKINKIVTSVLIIIITSKAFNDALKELFHFYTERGKKKLFVLKMETILHPSLTDITLREDFKDLLTMIKTSYKCINFLDSPNFIYITKYLHFSQFPSILKNSKFDIKIRKIFVATYFKFYYINNFRVFSNLTKSQFDDLSEICTSSNIIGNIEEDQEEFNLLFDNLEKFPFIFDCFSGQFGRSLKFFLSYFQEVIIVPCLNASYKIIYFSKAINSKLKYLLYKLVLLFFEVYRFLLKNLIDFNYASKINFVLLSDYFFNLNINRLEDDFKDIIHSLDADISNMNSETFKLDLTEIIEKFTNYCRKFIYFKIIQKEKYLDESGYSDYYIRIKNIYKEYKKKKKDFFNKNNVIFNLFMNSDDERLQTIKKTIILNLLMRLKYSTHHREERISLYVRHVSSIKDEDEEQLSEFANNDIFFESLNNLFKSDPLICQEVMKDMASKTKELLRVIMRKQFPFLIQSVFIDFNRLEDSNSKKNSQYQFFLTLLEFLRLFNEEHHKIFQTFFINDLLYDEPDKFRFIEFIQKIGVYMINHIDYNKKKSTLAKFYKPDNAAYFNQLSVGITDFMSEILQGTYTFNFDNFVCSQVYNEYIEKHYKLIDILDTDEEYEFIESQFMRLIITLLEEHTNSENNKSLIFKRMTPSKLLIALYNSFQKLYYKYQKLNFESNSEEGKYKEIMSPFASEEMKEFYILEQSFVEDPLFVLSSLIFYFFTIGEYNKNGKKIVKMLETWRAYINTNIAEFKEKERNSFLVKRESYLFFNSIVKSIDLTNKISYEMSDKFLLKFRHFFSENLGIYKKIKKNMTYSSMSLEKTVFIVHPTSLLIVNHDVINFLSEAPIENMNEKLQFFISTTEHFIDTAEMRKLLFSKKSAFLNFMFKINYHYLEIISVILGLLTNLINIISIRYQTIGTEQHKETVIIEPLMPLALQIQFIHLIFNLFFVANWLAFRMIKLNKFVHEGKTLSFFEKAKDYLVLLIDPEVFPLMWMVLFNIISSISKEANFLSSLLLFPIFYLNANMKIVITAIQARYQKFLYTALLIFIFILIYAGISFSFIKDDFYQDDLKENTCNSLLQCFLTIFNSGLRSGLGIFPDKSYLNQRNEYYFHFLFGWLFFFLMMLILINIVNGIIVDTFQDLREKHNERENVRVNFCYVCSLNRTKFDMRGINFFNHITNEHSILDYLYYIMKISLTNEHDLNSLDRQILTGMKNLKIDFFPIKNAFSVILADEMMKGKK